jgi:hypothetical protein
MTKRWQVHPDTCRYLSQRSVTVHVAETREAVKIYNGLTGDTPVAGALPFHLLNSAPAASIRAAA